MRETVEEGKDRMMSPSTLKKEGKMLLSAYLAIYILRLNIREFLLVYFNVFIFIYSPLHYAFTPIIPDATVAQAAF